MKFLLLVWCLAACSPAMPAGPVLLHRDGLVGTHVPSCVMDSACGDGQEPPLGGPHCPSPLACRDYPTAQNRCEWIHNLEHGHLVLAYNCPAGCPDVEQKLRAVWAAQPDPKRALVTPDPKLTAKVGVLVWGWGWLGESVDDDAVAAVIAKQDVDAPERGLACAP